MPRQRLDLLRRFGRLAAYAHQQEILGPPKDADKGQREDADGHQRKTKRAHDGLPRNSGIAVAWLSLRLGQDVAIVMQHKFRRNRPVNGGAKI